MAQRQRVYERSPKPILLATYSDASWASIFKLFEQLLKKSFLRSKKISWKFSGINWKKTENSLIKWRGPQRATEQLTAPSLCNRSSIFQTP